MFGTERTVFAQLNDYTNGQNDYRINFSKDYNKGVQAEFDDCSYSIIPLSNSDITGNETVAEYLDEKFEVFQYKNIYGEGTNLRFYPQLTGIVRKVDELGRIVLPIELRRTLDIAEKDALEIFVEGDNIILHKYHPSCIFCENTKNIISYKGKNVCPACIKTLKEKL